MRPERVAVVIPTYNERENLPRLVPAVRQHGFGVVIVDDGSPDGTGDIADSAAAADPMVSVVHRAVKAGLGPAYSHGFDLVLQSDIDVVVEMDADLSHDPEDLPRLVGAIEAGADLAIGSRYVPGGSTPDWSILRRLISRGGNLYARLLLGLDVRDATAGFRAFRAEALRQLPYREAEASGYGFQVEMVWKAQQAGFHIVEVPVVFRDRTAGASKMDRRIVWEAMRLVTRWGWGRIRVLLPPR